MRICNVHDCTAPLTSTHYRPFIDGYCGEHALDFHPLIKKLMVAFECKGAPPNTEYHIELTTDASRGF